MDKIKEKEIEDYKKNICSTIFIFLIPVFFTLANIGIIYLDSALERRFLSDTNAVFQENIEAICTSKEYVPASKKRTMVFTGSSLTHRTKTVSEKFSIGLQYSYKKELKDVKIDNRIVYEASTIGDPITVALYKRPNRQLIIKEKKY